MLPVVEHAGRHRILTGLHEIQRDAPFGLHTDVGNVDPNTAELVDDPISKIALRHDRGPTGTTPKLGQQAGHIGLGAGCGGTQLLGINETFTLIAGEPDLPLADGRDVVGHAVTPVDAAAVP